MDRSDSDVQELDAYRHSSWITGPYAGTSSTNHYQVAGTSKVRTWVGSPKPWKTTKSYMVRRFRQWPAQYATSVNHSYYGLAEEDGIGYVTPSEVLGLLNSVSHPTIEADTKNAVLKQVAGASWAAPVFLAELDDAGKLVKKLATVYRGGADMIMKALMSRQYRRSLYYRMRRFLSGHGFGPRPMQNQTGLMADAWLEWRYAVQTLALDARDAGEAAAEVMRDTPRTRVHELSHRTQVTGANTQTFGSGPLRYGNVYQAYASTTASWTTWIECRAWISAERRYDPPLAQIQAVGLLNWPANVWEMLPGSFIADWVLNLGQYLELTSALVGWRVTDSGFSSLKRVGGESVVNFVSSLPYGITSVEATAEPVRFEASIYNRSSWVNPSVVWSPAFRMNTERWLDAAALIRGSALRKFKIV